MKNKKYFIIYISTNLKNSKFYIGAHVTSKIDDGYLGSGKVLRNSVYYHGKENFKKEILEFCENKEMLFKREAELVNEDLLKNPLCMNLKVGGDGGFLNDEHRKKFFEKAKENSKFNSLLAVKRKAEIRKGNPNWQLEVNRKSGEGVRRYYRDNNIVGGFYGKKHSELSKEKISKANKIALAGAGNSQYDTRWITNDIDNKKIMKNDNLPDGWHYGRIIKKL